MYELRPIERDAIPRALAKAERYRLLNEPSQAQSICRDILATDPGNQPALVCLILAITDEFSGGEGGCGVGEAHDLLPRLTDRYERLYYEGVVQERWARALMVAKYAMITVSDSFSAAMKCFDEAASCAPEGNDDAILRWNACVRFMEQHRLDAVCAMDDAETYSLDDDVPMR